MTVVQLWSYHCCLITKRFWVQIHWCKCVRILHWSQEKWCDHSCSNTVRTVSSLNNTYFLHSAISQNTSNYKYLIYIYITQYYIVRLSSFARWWTFTDCTQLSPTDSWDCHSLAEKLPVWSRKEDHTRTKLNLNRKRVVYWGWQNKYKGQGRKLNNNLNWVD